MGEIQATPEPATLTLEVKNDQVGYDGGARFFTNVNVTPETDDLLRTDDSAR